ncbi:flagellar hook-length control protein FliK [Variovorax sp. YR216]|uniref:flagellar hook-length control protein FliK n=1 Tax=Variovorax sp. YR216 TaxID=1882828 RepID=UPI000898752D|nr:flagellar hook-length control protein FliK [Variovorax sp. YR216]SEA42227.1 flagellar hook-length control protein FliK [Variovorax sp. YR216]
MPTVISPSINLSGLQGAAAGPRGRNAEQSDGRSFGAALDRSRATSAADAQQTAEVSSTETLAGRKTTRPGEKKSELSADDVMALLAPLSAPVVPVAAQGKLTPEAAAKADAAKAADGLAASAQSPALPQDAATLAAASSKDGPEQDARTAFAKEGAQDAHAAKPAADQADNAGLPLATAAATAATTSDAGASANATAPSLTPASTPVIPPTADAKATVAAKPATAADANVPEAATDKSAAVSQATAAVEAAKPDAPAAHTATASVDPVTEPAPQALAGLQASAAPAIDRAVEPAKTTPTLAVAPEVGSSEWGTAVGHQMIRMSTGGHQVAELNLNPANLGPLKVTLTMGDNQAQAMFVSAHESVRKAVEAALPQLRTTLAEQGINLGQTSVGAETRQPNGGSAFAEQNPQRPQGQPDYPGSGRADSAATQPVAAAPSASTPRRATAGLDTFA